MEKQNIHSAQEHTLGKIYLNAFLNKVSNI